MPTSTTTENNKNGTANKTKNHSGNIFKGFGTWKGLIVLSIALLIAFSLNLASKRIGMNIGKEAGRTAGRLAGSFDGITDGIKEGKEEGKEEGLSAKDTTVDIGNRIQAIGKLEVLSASVTVHDYMGISKKYGTVFALHGDIVFTVDLTKAQINKEGYMINVKLPEPEPNPIFDEKRTEQLAVDMKHSWSGSNEDGYNATMNSFKELSENLQSSVSNYAELMDSARQSAQKQVTFLIKSASGEEVYPNVEFQEDEQPGV